MGINAVSTYQQKRPRCQQRKQVVVPQLQARPGAAVGVPTPRNKSVKKWARKQGQFDRLFVRHMMHFPGVCTASAQGTFICDKCMQDNWRNFQTKQSRKSGRSGETRVMNVPYRAAVPVGLPVREGEPDAKVLSTKTSSFCDFQRCKKREKRASAPASDGRRRAVPSRLRGKWNDSTTTVYKLGSCFKHFFADAPSARSNLDRCSTEQTHRHLL